ncbi:MAG: DUF3880 domain-containing protein [Solidesulfovibrio sp.]
MPHPPRQLRLTDETGSPKTLLVGHDVVQRTASRDWLVLGLGPDPLALAESLPPEARVGYLECPDFFDQAGEDWRAAIAAGWQRVESFDPLCDQNILFYSAGMTLFPSFWGPVSAALLLPRPAPSGITGQKTALVPAEKSRLIAAEVARALKDEGFAVQSVDRSGLIDVLEQSRPDLFLSVNFSGLDCYGEVQSVLARAGVPVAVWCVDNPFHSLSGVKCNAWKDLHLFVTDDWFVDPLRRHGAKHVHHLPLAANPDFFHAVSDRPDLADKLLFVGHSAFPGKELFFSGHSLRRDLWDEARDMLLRGARPDFGWWADRLGVERFWPGLQARCCGFGAEQAGLAWRSLVIREAAGTGNLVVCGDDAWAELEAASFELLPCVGYYDSLAGLYASARYVVGAVSPLLPHGLTQRHFDVWAAGGCLLTDNTPGLGLFPEELTRPITYQTAREIPELAHSLEKERADLAKAWREQISRGHTYRHRIRYILERIG